MRSVILSASLLFAAVHADTIKLNDGTVLQGEIVSSDDESHLVRVQVTESIRDERRIPKADIAEIIRERKDIAAFEEIKDLVPTPDLLESADYQRRIELIRKFLEEHPDTNRRKDAEALIETLREEQVAVEAGGIKFEGELIGPEERKSRAFPLDSSIAAARVERLAKAGDLTAALRTWDELQKNFPTSRAYVESIPLAMQIMRAHSAAISSSLSTIDKRREERTQGLERIPTNDRPRVIRLLKEDADDYRRKVAAETEANIRWISVHPFFSVQLNEVDSLLKNEITQLESINTSGIPDGDKAWNEAWKMIHAEETEGSEDATADPDQAVSIARAARLPEKYITILEKEAEAEKNKTAEN